MYEYIKGELVEATPANAVVDCGGVGYYIHISVNTYSKIASQNQVMLYIHQIVREDAHLLYGFFSKEERSLFRALISVSGIGANTANVMLSSMSVEEITGAILTENVNAIKSVKGIGVKTAQRVIIELKDKAQAALVMLGFARAQVAKTLDKILASEKVETVENLIKLALKHL